MTLFGSPAPPRVRTPAIPWPTAADAVEMPFDDPHDEAPVISEPRAPAAFERRAQLREERHRLVSEVRRRDGTSHREINAWLNRKLGISSVEQATLADLERSVELLVGKLSSRR
jgi:hypothetical protein